MKIFLRRLGDEILLSFDRQEGDVEVRLDIPEDSEGVLRAFAEVQKHMEDDRRVSLEILMAECFRLGRIFQ